MTINPNEACESIRRRVVSMLLRERSYSDIRVDDEVLDDLERILWKDLEVCHGSEVKRYLDDIESARDEEQDPAGVRHGDV